MTPDKVERLAMLAEECAEVIQMVGKILRHGYDNHHPDNPAVTNRELLAKELVDLDAVIKEMARKELKDLTVRDTFGTAWQKKIRFSYYQE